MHGFSISDKLGRDQYEIGQHQLGELALLIYRFLTGDDDAAFCHKVTKALSEGWRLHGSPSYAYDAAAKKMRAGQAVTRVAPDQPYDPDKSLLDF